MFAYCGNNPVNQTDENGLDPIPIWAKNILTGKATPLDYAIALNTNSEAWSGIAGRVVLRAIQRAEIIQKSHPVYTGRNENFTPRKDSRKGSENRQKSGLRERNIGHKNGEEHSRVPKGNRSGFHKTEEVIVPVVLIVVSSVAVTYLIANDLTLAGIADDAMILPFSEIIWDNACKLAAM